MVDYMATSPTGAARLGAKNIKNLDEGVRDSNVRKSQARENLLRKHDDDGEMFINTADGGSTTND